MPPRQSTGTTAHDAIDISFSDTEPSRPITPAVVSDVKDNHKNPSTSSGSTIPEVTDGERVKEDIAKPVPDAYQSSSSDLVEIVNGGTLQKDDVRFLPPLAESSSSDLVELVNVKRIRRDNAGEASTGLTFSSYLPASKRIRQALPDVPIDQPVKRKNTARKSTQHISTTQRLRREAGRANNVAVTDDDNDNITHEEAMRRAAAERRRSQSARKASNSPTKLSAKAGPGPNTVYQGTLAFEPAPVASESSPDPLTRPSSAQSSVRPNTRDSPIPISATVPIPAWSGPRARPSPFQVSDTPGSWGHAVPMSVPQRPISRNRNPNPSPGSSTPASIVPEPAGIALAELGATVSESTPKFTTTAAIIPSQPIAPVRKGPTWKTAPSPSPEQPISPLPSDPIEVDELEEEEGTTTASVPEIRRMPSPPVVASSRDQSTVIDEKALDLQTTVEPTADGGPLFDRTSPLPDLPNEPLVTLDCDEVPKSLPVEGTSHNGVALVSTPVDQNPIIGLVQPDDMALERLPATTTGAVSNAAPAAVEANLASDSVPVPHPVLSTATTVEPSSSELTTKAPTPDTKVAVPSAPKPTDTIYHEVIEIDDFSDSLPEVMDHVDLNRSRASSSGDSVEEIPAEIARTQLIFSRSAATPLSATAGSSIPSSSDAAPVAEKRVLRRSLVGIATDNIVPQAGPSRPIRLEIEAKARSNSASSSSSGSPSKRQSNRLASRVLTPVYNFNINTSSYIAWRQTVEMDGESDVEDLLRPPSSATSSGSSSMTIDGVERTITRIFNVPIVDSVPPPERRSTAIRRFDTQLIDDWNKMSPTLTHNPALHRLIFESYIDQCVDGDEPEIKVYNNVDFESIPPHFEFQYSNKMLYHENVPEPELGLGCDCEGGCSESSITCSCLKRQRLYNYDVNNDFAYDEDGHLKNAVPIWECGPNCGCPPECMNRVVQRGRSDKALVDLFKTRQKGWGVRARANIAAGTFLGIYAGELIAEDESERRGNIYAQVGRTYLFDCDGYQIGHPPKGLEKVDTRLAELARDSALRAKQAAEEQDDPSSVYNAYSIDAFHYGNFTRFFNHSCDPNLQIVQAYVNDFHPERPLLVIFTRREVKAGQELCISYKGVPDEEEVIEDGTKKSGKSRKIKKPKTTAAVHISDKRAAKKDQCFCGARNCDGVMFNFGADT